MPDFSKDSNNNKDNDKEKKYEKKQVKFKTDFDGESDKPEDLTKSLHIKTNPEFLRLPTSSGVILVPMIPSEAILSCDPLTGRSHTNKISTPRVSSQSSHRFPCGPSPTRRERNPSQFHEFLSPFLPPRRRPPTPPPRIYSLSQAIWNKENTTKESRERQPIQIPASTLMPILPKKDFNSEKAQEGSVSSPYTTKRLFRLHEDLVISNAQPDLMNNNGVYPASIPTQSSIHPVRKKYIRLKKVLLPFSKVVSDELLSKSGKSQEKETKVAHTQTVGTLEYDHSPLIARPTPIRRLKQNNANNLLEKAKCLQESDTSSDELESEELGPAEETNDIEMFKERPLLPRPLSRLQTYQENILIHERGLSHLMDKESSSHEKKEAGYVDVRSKPPPLRSRLQRDQKYSPRRTNLPPLSLDVPLPPPLLHSERMLNLLEKVKAKINQRNKDKSVPNFSDAQNKAMGQRKSQEWAQGENKTAFNSDGDLKIPRPSLRLPEIADIHKKISLCSIGENAKEQEDTNNNNKGSPPAQTPTQVSPSQGLCTLNSDPVSQVLEGKVNLSCAPFSYLPTVSFEDRKTQSEDKQEDELGTLLIAADKDLASKEEPNVS